jgi:sporulation protein YlmC with PRC-barrel domain
MQPSPEQQDYPSAQPVQPTPSLTPQASYPAPQPTQATSQQGENPPPYQQPPTIPMSSASGGTPTQPLRPQQASPEEYQPIQQPGASPVPSTPRPQQASSSQRVSWVSFSQLIGHPLVDITEGRKIGEVRDVLLDEQRRVIQAFSTKGGLLRGPTYVPALKATIGADAVTFQPGTLAGQDTSWLDRLPKASEIIGMRVLTNTGKLIGTVDNLRLDPNNNTLLALEVKPEHTSTQHRLGSGRRLMPATGVISYGPDTIVAQETDLMDA